jgi:hypothetical protein
MHTGGFFATAVMMAVTYSSGWLLELSGRLGEAWSHVTPGQAALVIGLLTYLTHNGPKLFRAAASLWRRMAGAKDAPDSR